MSIIDFCMWLEGTPVALMVRESLWGFPILVAIHIVGLTTSAGVIFWFDLRLLGAGMQRIPVAELYRRLMPWMMCGFIVMFVTGGMLFAGFATKAYGNLYFRVKVAGLLLAAVNAAVFHFGVERSIGRWNEAARPPRAARMAGAASILLWTTVILAGRMMSYTMF